MKQPRMDNQIVVYLHNGKWAIDTHKYRDESQNNLAEWVRNPDERSTYC